MSWFRRGGLDAAGYEALSRELGRRPRVLALGRADDTEVIGLEESLVSRRGAEWTVLPWHMIERGGWDKASRELHWVTTEGAEGRIALTEPGRLPDLFRERVTASIVVHRVFPVDGKRSVTIVARRDLGRPKEAVAWSVRPGPGVDLSAPGIGDLVNAEVARLKDEYDIT